MAELGTLMRQGLEGYDAGTDRAALEESRKIGLDDQKFQSQRRKTVAGREDVQYQRKEKDYQRETKSKKAIQAAMVNDDYSQIISVFNEGSPDGYFFSINKNQDGTYSTMGKDDKGKVTENTYKTKEEFDDFIMPKAMMMGKMGGYEEIEKRRAEQKAGKAKAGDRAHDLAKIDRKGSWDMSIAGLKEGGKGGKGSLKYKKYAKGVEKDMESKAKSRHGTMTGLGNYDMSGIEAVLANYDTTIGFAMHEAYGMGVSDSYTRAFDKLNSAHRSISKDAMTKYPDDDTEQEQYVRHELEKFKNSELLKIQGQGKKPQQGKTSPKEMPKAKAPPSYDKWLAVFLEANKDKGVTEAKAKAYYEKHYSADKQGVTDAPKNTKAKKEKGLTEPKKKLSFKEEVELYRTPTRKSTKGFKSSSGGHRSDKAQEAANKAAKSFKRGIKLSEPELRLALNADANERTKRAIIKKIKEIKAKRKE